VCASVDSTHELRRERRRWLERETQEKTAGEMREGAAVGTRRMGRRCKEWEVG
jgi:hypothetical protein